jgi:hypothetical protein
MRTTHYNPSKHEVDFAKAFEDLIPQLETKLNEGERVIGIKSEFDIDNLMVIYDL